MPRIIYTLRYHCTAGRSIDVEFGRDGQPLYKPHHDWYGKPRPPKMRTIDLRAGDEIFLPPDWRRIERIVCLRDALVDEVNGAAGFVMLD
ncbi:hypothetical protein [Lacipirellula sp.]|uniref:hypothetical protein n=1 Tax=Lacipirellula sp. TaxID=2691419 RepID=UPI003D0B9892